MASRSCRVALTVCAMALSGLRAAEHADFLAGVGTDGWTIAGNEYASPLYPNAVDQIRLAYSSANSADTITLYATSDQGDESPIATFTAASDAASLEFPDTTDFRSFRLVIGGSLTLSSFDAEVSMTSLPAPAYVTVTNNTTGSSFSAL